MVLEATVLCLDNSEWMRNGDFSPTRLSAQADAVNLVCGSKIQPNPENSIGILTMAVRPDVLCTLTQDMGKILNCVHGVRVEGSISLLASLKIAKLVLRHRANKHQKQRIVVFVGSPVEEVESELIRVAKNLRKANVSVDVVNFGVAENADKLEKFVNAVNKDGSSHLLCVPQGTTVLSDVLVTSPIIGGDNGSSFNEFGVDPNMDPDLAMVLRLSAEEERERQRNRAGEGGEGGGETQPQTTQEPEMDDEQAMLAEAIRMSMEASGATEDSAPSQPETHMMSEEEQIALAMQMSLDENNEREEPKTEDMDVDDNVENTEFLDSVLDSLPGVEDEEKKE